jgi:hypothetical protein
METALNAIPVPKGMPDIFLILNNFSRQKISKIEE